MFLGLRTTIYRVEDPEKAKAWYSKVLGVAPYFDEPFYIGFNVGGYELGIQPLEGKSLTVETYWGVENAEEVYAKLLQDGCAPYTPVEEVGGGIKVAMVMDPFKNHLGIIENPHFKLASE